MDNEQDTLATSKKKLDKDISDKLEKKSEKKSDTDDPKPRIVLTFRSEKPGAKSSTMKIVQTEEKHEEVSPRRSSRTRAAKWIDSDDDNEVLVSPKKVGQPSENEDASDNAHTTPKRSTRRRSKEFDNVIANAIARKEKWFSEGPTSSRPSRRIRPTAKVLANEELRDSQSHVGTSENVQEKSPEEGVRTRRSARSSRQTNIQDDVVVNETKSNKDGGTDGEQNQVMKLKHLCELGLKAINTEDDYDDDDDCSESEASAAIEIEDSIIASSDEEIDDDTEVISKLLEADADTLSGSDEDFCYYDEVRQVDQPRRSTRRQGTTCGTLSSSEPDQGDDEQSAPRRRSSRKKRKVPPLGYEDIVGSYLPQHKKSRPSAQETIQVEDEQEDVSDPAGGEEGAEAECPGDKSTVVASCYCEEESNMHPAPEHLTEPAFCQAIEMVDGVRVGCSHVLGPGPPLRRAGPRAPYAASCPLHAAQLRAHMCCPACGLYCTQGIFYQCSKSHLFHLECGLPYNDSKQKTGCPHCGVYSYRWQPVNRECFKVRVEMKCSNKRIFLPEQREQCTPAYLGFSTLAPTQLDQEPIIPEDLLPSPPIDLKRLCQKTEGDEEGTPERLLDAILAGESVDELIPKITTCPKLNASFPSLGGGTCVHAAAQRGHVAALYLLQYAGAALDAADASLRTPLMCAVLALLEKSDKKTLKKSKNNIKEEKELDESKEEQSDKEEKGDKVEKTELKQDKPSDEDLMKVIRYLVAAGCDVNIPGPDGMTALHMAAQLGGAAACGALLAAAGGSTEPRDHGGWTPLVWAAENCHAPVVRLLLSHGADAMATDSDSNAAIHWCALAGAATPLRLLLDAAPRAAHAPNAHADTPLHVAARQGHYACVVILLARGARTDVENSAGELPVEVCTGKCQSAISLNMQMSIAVRDKTTRRRLLTSDISRGREEHPVPCVNEVDDTPLPEDFTYVTSHVTPQPISIDTTIESLQGCACAEGEGGGGGGGGDCAGTCACCVLGVRRWFSRGRLPPAFPHHDPPMLFECNQTCACNAKKCTNSVITQLSQRGSLFIRAEVFRCGSARGWGLRAAARVPRGSPVATYCGELLTLAAADTRPADQYMFALDIKPDLLAQCPDKTVLCVDAAQYGGAARFINHSCRPNLAPVRVFTATRDLRAPTIALFAIRDLAPGDELTFDYGDKFWSVKSKWMTCECGTVECRYAEKSAEENYA